MLLLIHYYFWSRVTTNIFLSYNKILFLVKLLITFFFGRSNGFGFFHINFKNGLGFSIWCGPVGWPTNFAHDDHQQTDTSIHLVNGVQWAVANYSTIR